MNRPAIVLITNDAPLERLVDTLTRAATAVPRGTLLVQLRDKASSLDVLVEKAHVLREATSRVDAGLVVNTGDVARSIDVARRVRADGVHVPCASAPLTTARAALGDEAWISVPAHSNEDVVVARDRGATAALVSPIFATPGKGTPRGVEALRDARALARNLLLYALGGVDGARSRACAVEGADGVAVIRALLDAPDPVAEAAALAAPWLSR